MEKVGHIFNYGPTSRHSLTSYRMPKSLSCNSVIKGRTFDESSNTMLELSKERAKLNNNLAESIFCRDHVSDSIRCQSVLDSGVTTSGANIIQVVGVKPSKCDQWSQSLHTETYSYRTYAKPHQNLTLATWQC